MFNCLFMFFVLEFQVPFELKLCLPFCLSVMAFTVRLVDVLSLCLVLVVSLLEARCRLRMISRVRYINFIISAIVLFVEFFCLSVTLSG